MLPRFPSLCLSACFAASAVPALLTAQVNADLAGRVSDATGSAVSGARVALTKVDTGVQQEAVTTGSGQYVFTHVVPGAYRVDVDAPGFMRLSRTGITVLTGQTINADLSLKVGSQGETMSVDADAPLLQAVTSNVQTTIPGRTVLAEPLNSRNFVQLATLAPGVELPPGTVLPRINGGRPRTNEYLYDGISALQPEPGQVVFFPIIDGIQEFTVQSNNVPAEFGRFNGGVVNVATRSGSNQWHGSLFEFFRNEALNSRNYFAPTGRKPEYRRNLYGGTLGFPLLKDHLFFFGDYQGVKQLVGVTRLSVVPTLAQRAGNFGNTAIYDPATTTVVNGRYIRRAFPNNTINRPFDAAAMALLARIPLPNTTGTSNYTRTANDSDHQNQFDVRLDGAYGTRDHAFVRYTYYNEVETPVAPFPEGSGVISGSVIGTGNVLGPSNVLGQQAVASETHTFTPHLIFDGRAGYTRRANYINGPSLGSTASAALGIPGIPTNAEFNNALPLFTFTGFQQLGPSASTFSQYQTGVWQTVDSLVFTRGRHVVKAGADIRWYQLNAISPPNPTGSFAFTTTGTNTQSATAAASSGGNAFASFLLGQVDTFSIDLQTSTIRPRDHIQEYFVQDDWRVMDKLTLNLGARWTLHSPSTEKNNQGAVFNLATQRLDYLGGNGYPRSARELHYGNVAPRIGFAYTADAKTVIRSGFGIVFIDQSGITTPFTTPQFPFIQNVQQRTQDSINSAFALSRGPTVAPIALTPDAGLGQSVYTADRTAGSGYVEQWNVAFQRALTNNLSFDIAYVGSHVVHVGIPDFNLNQLTAAQLATGLTNPTALTGAVPNPYFTTGGTCSSPPCVPNSSTIGSANVAAAQLLKPYPRFQNVAIYRNNTGTTNYNAIEAKVEQRFSHGVYLLFGYTHSKLIDDASSVFSSTVLSSPNTSSLVAADTYRPYLERDSSSGDMPNVLTVSGIYDLPAGHGHQFASVGAPAVVLGGWQVNAIATVESGMPVTVTQATNNNAFAGFALQRPNLLANPSLAPADRTPAHFFNTSAFTTAPQFTLGNASRNPVRGPAYRDLDFALVKNTHLAELAVLEFRAELFNVTNTPAFSQPNGSFGSAAFGSITSTTTDPRVVQFALRLHR